MLNNMFFKRVTGCLLVMTFVSGCSVYKASSNKGVAVSDIKDCPTRSCFLTRGMELVEHRREKNGEYVEVYRGMARKSGATYARAVGHGALDVMTLGLWEVAGTPIEGAMSNNRGYIVAEATYPNKDNERVASLQIYDPKSKLVFTNKKKA